MTHHFQIHHAVAAAVLLCCASAQWAAAHEDIADQGTSVQQVVVKGQALKEAAAAYSTTRFDEGEVRERNVSTLQDLFRYVPGMEVRGFKLGGVADAFVLRGFGNGGHGGDVGLVMDGIPLNEAMSHADGYADLNVVIPLEVGDMRVLRGPVSAQYGNFNRGGLILLESRKGGRYRDLDAQFGSFRTSDVQLAMGDKVGPGLLNLAAQGFHTDGYRPQSRFDRGTVAGRYALDLSPTVGLAVSGRVHRGNWTSSSYLTEAQFNNPDTARGKDPRVVDDGGHKDFATARLDASVLLAPDTKLLAFVYGTSQDFTRYFTRPISTAVWRQREESYDRGVGGAGANLNGTLRLGGTGGIAVGYVAGAEFIRESTDFQFFDALVARARTLPAQSDRRYRFNSAAAFVEAAAAIHPLFQPTLGLRYDKFSGSCSRLGAETSTSPCDALQDDGHFSPKLGLRSVVSTLLTLRASVTKGYALPDADAKYSTGARDLKANSLQQRELGAAFNFGPQLKADVAVYRINSSDEIRTVAAGVYENFGQTRRNGVEFSADWHPLHDLHIDTTYATARSSVRENANAALVGKQVTGVPASTGTVSAHWRPEAGLGGGATLRKVGSYAVNAANTVYYAGYETVDLQISWSQGGSAPWRAFVSVDNATDKRYASSAAVIGGVPVYAPAAPRAVTVGLQASFQ